MTPEEAWEAIGAIFEAAVTSPDKSPEMHLEALMKVNDVLLQVEGTGVE